MTAKEYNEKVLSNREIVELADAMGLGEVATVSFKESKAAGPYRVYKFDNGVIYTFQSSVRANVRLPRASVDIELASDTAEQAIEQARALNVAAYIASKNV